MINMELKYKKRLLIYLSITLGIGAYFIYEHPYTNGYSINMDENSEAFGSYSKGNIYIGTRTYLSSLMGKINPGDVLIEQGYKVDEGYNDPNYKIYSSHLITDREDRNDILNVLSIYNKSIPWNFNRTLESMRIEWTVHNLLYELGIEQDRTNEVDLNNGDEVLYSNPIFKSLIK